MEIGKIEGKNEMEINIQFKNEVKEKVNGKDQNFLKRKTNRIHQKDKDKLIRIKQILDKPTDSKIKADVTKKLAFDCEMVEINKIHNGLARISVVNEHGEILINTLCKPKGEITDYRSNITGLFDKDLDDAVEYEEIRKQILKLFKNKILIGHSLDNDLLSLDYEHPKTLIRDTSKFKYFRNNINQPFSLKFLSELHLDKIIQTASHDSIEDARAALCLYKLFEEEIEKELVNKNHKLIRKNVVEDAKKLHSLFGI